MVKKQITKEAALERLTSLCSRSEQCEFQINRKMLNWGLSRQDRDEILNYLIENRYVDNARFASSYAHDKAAFSAWGPFKIKAELYKLRIPTGLISDSLKNVDTNLWKEGILRIAKSKAKSLNLKGEESRGDREKLYRYLISRGFSSALSSKVVLHLKRQQEDKE